MGHQPTQKTVQKIDSVIRANVCILPELLLTSKWCHLIKSETIQRWQLEREHNDYKKEGCPSQITAHHSKGE